MNCADFEQLLPDLVARDRHDRTTANREEALQHCSACARCARLLAVARGELDLLETEDAEVAIQAILQRTGRDACAAAESRLPARADGLLQGGDADLLAGHLAHCPNCLALAEALAVLREELPTLAEADPGPDFAASILALTSGSAHSAHRRVVRTFSGRGPLRVPGPSLLPDVREAGSAWRRYWADVMRRPRAPLELAYGASLIFCLAVGSPATRVRQAATEVTALVSRVPSPRLSMASVVPENPWDGAIGSVRALVVKQEERAPRGVVARLARAWKRTSALATATRTHGPVLGQALLRLDLVRAWQEAEVIRQTGIKSGEPASPAVRPENDGGTATPGGAGIGPAASKGGTS